LTHCKMDCTACWCPGCDREIIPKRLLVPREPSPADLPAPKRATPAKKSKTTRTRAGLVHGTGRVKPNGALKSAEPAAPIKMKSIVDPSPLPLYCSDECRMADMGSVYSNDCPSTSTPLTPRHPLSDASSFDSDDSDSSADSEYTNVVNKSLRVLAEAYNFPAIPHAPRVRSPPRSSQKPSPPEYNGGMIMAGRRIAEYLKPEPDNRSEYQKKAGKQPRKLVKGWNDGSTEWRAHIYNFATSNKTHPDDVAKAYGSQVAFSHRSSNGVTSTLGEGSSPSTSPISPVARTSSWHDSYETEELYAKFSASLSKKAEQRAVEYPASAPSVLRSRQPVKGLLVPEIKRRPVSSESLEPVNTVLPVPRPRFETRAWSYDNVLTYPCPPPKPSRYETKTESQIVNGVETEVTVQVPVYDKPKCLFNFPPRDYPIDYSKQQRRR
jgi:hypothetical protein